ncbi:MAG: MBL fold metallo-hydrolase [Gemmatimonadota bacterium]|nr:MBL fold metallo-hydrolase [Gemmatimonadota bacterium]
MSLVHTFRVGGLTCHTLDAGRQRLDGGAMFGVVPKPMWEKRIPPDEQNRIPLALRCLLVEHDAGPILVDTGIGNKERPKFMHIYGVENAGQTGPTQLEDALAAAGFAPSDITYVINTHLHFDHAGGNTCLQSSPTVSDRPGPSGGQKGQEGPRLAFPNATYIVQERELAFGFNTNQRTAASYLPPNYQPIAEADRWRLVQGETEVLPGIRVLPTPGHVPYHQSVLIQSGGESACYLGDLVPTTAHVPLPWIMGYDLEPLVTLETKRQVLERAAAEGWLLVFEHDPVHAVGHAVRDRKSFAYQPLDTP